ncbi:M4 family metallopeptidase [Alkalibacillus silvisoli]|uniref:Neutral metalloproteinase n=1 Tax=Alkalibacillus silvisoli TaxID=392823 RepID=A0ABP3JEP3_9BACI
MKRMRRTTSVVLATTLLFGGVQTSYAIIEGDLQAPHDTSQQKVTELQDHVPIFVQEKQTERFESSDVESAKSYLSQKKGDLGIQSVDDDLKVKDVEEDELGMTHIRFIQKQNGIPIEGTEVIVHFNDQNEVVLMNGHVSDHQSVGMLNTYATLSENEAIENAKTSVEAPDELSYEPESELVIYPFDGENHLAHKVNVNFMSDDPGNWFVYIDAHNGQVIDQYNAIHPIEEYEDAMEGHKGVGTGVHGEHRGDLHMSRVKPDNGGTVFMLADHSHDGLEGIYTYDHNTGDLAENNSASFKDEYHHPAVDAHYNSEIVYEYYKEEHDRNSLDDEGMAIISYVNYGTDFNNAFWNGRHMTYGNGDGDFMVPLSAGLDVAAHEMTHGVITNTANLVYRYQPGALNEAYADIFGAIIDDENWEIGEDIMGPGAIEDGRTALRSLSDPSKFPVNEEYIEYGDGDGMYPSHMDEYYDLPLHLDNGGVHINSSIINHAAYLTAQEIGRDALGQIYYRALVHYLTPNSDFDEARQVIVQSAVDLYGEDSDEALATASGFDQVGIYEE